MNNYESIHTLSYKNILLLTGNANLVKGYSRVRQRILFVFQLLQELCSAFKLDLPFRRKSSNFGILKGEKIKNATDVCSSSSFGFCFHSG